MNRYTLTTPYTIRDDQYLLIDPPIDRVILFTKPEKLSSDQIQDYVDWLNENKIHLIYYSTEDMSNFDPPKMSVEDKKLFTLRFG